MTVSHRFTLRIDSLNSEGEGVARLGREVYFVPGALPQEEVDVLLDGRRRKVWQTRLLKILTPSSERATPLCPHYQRCGGCDLQHLNYAAQVQYKAERVQRELARERVDVAHWASPIMSEPWHYRRKARVGVRYSKEKKLNIMGFREAASSHLTNIDRCVVLPEHPALDFAAWRELFNRLQGRALITQMEVVVAENALALVLRVLKPLTGNDTQKIQEFIQARSTSLVQLWLKEEKGGAPKLLWPSQAEALFHQVDGLQLNLGVDDFLQINKSVNQQMVAQAMAWLAPKEHEIIWDLFAGHGNFSMPLAKRGAQVWALEGASYMVESLNAQAQRLALSLSAQTVDLTAAQSLGNLPAPSAILLDPPRAGAAEIMPVLIASGAARILYVSCDVATLARDLALLNAHYRVVQAGIMDMFPQTHHVETMVLLEKKAKRHG
ncbi:MAG: hypothetical protein RL217_1526 [Pseudomonadota bacterium]